MCPQEARPFRRVPSPDRRALRPERGRKDSLPPWEVDTTASLPRGGRERPVLLCELRVTSVAGGSRFVFSFRMLFTHKTLRGDGCHKSAEQLVPPFLAARICFLGTKGISLKEFPLPGDKFKKRAAEP